MQKPTIHTDNCLKRAQELFKKGDEINLIYSALELRLGIECRLKQYLEGHNYSVKKLRKEYRLDKLNKSVIAHLKFNDKVAKVKIFEANSNKTLVLTYTPVRAELVKIGQQLGRYLHVSYEKIKIGMFKRLLKRGIKELSFSNRGDLIGSPLFDSTKKPYQGVAYILFKDRQKEKEFKKYFKEGKTININVKYCTIN